MYKIIISLFFALSISRVAFSEVCISNNFFEGEGWNTHENEDFSAVSKKVLAQYENNKKYFVADLETLFYSEELETEVNFKSLDDLRTPDREMYGDLIVLTLPSTGELLEVRWYADETKHIIYNHKLQRCAADLIPLADNTLF